MNLELLHLIKKTALDAVKEYGLTDITSGTVISVQPLNIEIDMNPKRVLPQEFFIVTKNTSDYIVEITIDGVKKEVTIHNTLKPGDNVVLLKVKRGQQYIVLEKMEVLP